MQQAVDRIGERRGVIIDATFGSRQHRAELGEKLGALGVDYCLIETQASNETVKRRLIEREGKTDEVSDGHWYASFGQTSDEEVQQLYQRSRLA